MQKYIFETGFGNPSVSYLFDSKFIIGGRQFSNIFTASFEGPFGIEISAVKEIPNQDRKQRPQTLVSEKKLAKSGPYVGLSCISDWLKGTLFLPDNQFPCSYKFEGPSIGYITLNTGYSAASCGSHSRRITKLTCNFDLDEKYLIISISGCAGPMVEGSYDKPGQPEYSEPTTFEVDLSIPVSDVHEVLHLNKYDTNFEKKLSKIKVANK